MADTTQSAQKTVLITGATRGIGFALVEKYLSDGWNVIAAARNLDSASADKLKTVTTLHKLVQIDTSDEASILKAAELLQGTPIDLLINNAGILNGGAIDVETKATLMEQFEVNSVAPFLMTRAFRSNLKQAADKHGQAVVAQISSFLGSIQLNTTVEGVAIPAGGMYGYRSSKAALNMINVSLAVDLKADKIYTLALHPGYVSTDINGNDPRGISTEKSADDMAKVLGGVTEAVSGKFFNHDGSPLPW